VGAVSPVRVDGIKVPLKRADSVDEPTAVKSQILNDGGLAIVGLVFAIGFVRLGMNEGFSELFSSARGIGEITELFMVAVGLAIAAVPASPYCSACLLVINFKLSFCLSIRLSTI